MNFDLHFSGSNLCNSNSVMTLTFEGVSWKKPLSMFLHLVIRKSQVCYLGVSMAEWFELLTDNHFPLTFMGLSLARDIIYEKAIQLAYRTLVVLLR